MEVILRQDVDKIGKAGSVIKVKDGYARNFLMPNGLAVPLTAANLKKLEQEKQNKLLGAQKLKEEAESLKDKLSVLSLTIAALINEEEKLYGSITVDDISAALSEEGFKIDKSAIVLNEPIKSLGIYEVSVKLHPEVAVNVKVWIVKK